MPNARKFTVTLSVKDESTGIVHELTKVLPDDDMRDLLAGQTRWPEEWVGSALGRAVLRSSVTGVLHRGVTRIDPADAAPARPDFGANGTPSW